MEKKFLGLMALKELILLIKTTMSSLATEANENGLKRVWSKYTISKHALIFWLISKEK